MRTEVFAEEERRCDAFLGGRVRIWQPKAGYRAGIDPVLLAASVAACKDQSVLELGCGAGVASCCLGWRVPGLALAGLEIQPGYAALARDNLAENGLQGEVWDGDVARIPADLRQRCFDHVIANPPFFETCARSRAPDTGREAGRGSDLPLAVWVDAAARRTAPGGTVSMIQRTERLAELITGFDACLGSLELLPFAPRQARAPKLAILRGRKGGRGPFRMHPTIILHRGDSHGSDGDNFTELVSGVLREGHGL